MQSASTSYLSEDNQLFFKVLCLEMIHVMIIWEFSNLQKCAGCSVYCTVAKSEILSQKCDKIFRDTCQLNTLDL